VVAEIRALAQEHGPKAITRLVELCGSKDERVAVAACQALLDRAYGKPSQELAITALAAAVFTGEARVVSDPLEAARVYAELMAGTVPLDAVRFLPKPAAVIEGQAAREPECASIAAQAEPAVEPGTAAPAPSDAPATPGGES
jgi:hypothetical protein